MTTARSALALSGALIRRATAPARCLPDFFVVGVMKAGTTSLFEQLVRDDAVRGPVRKELHYLDSAATPNARAYRQYFPVNRPGRTWLTGEATPITFHVPAAPAQLSRLVPAVRLLVLVRHPVDRAFSHFHHSRRLGHEPVEDFVAAMAAEDERVRQAQSSTTWLEDWAQPMRTWAYARRSEYAPSLQRWLAHFPREQLLVLRNEDLAAEPVRTLARAREHLGLAEVLRTPAGQSRRNAHPHSRLAPEVRRSLGGRFRDDIAATEDLLGQSLAYDL